MRIPLFAYLPAVISLLFIAGACGGAPSPPLDESAIRAYADPATETTLEGLSEHDLDKYIQYGNDDFKEAVTQELFDQVALQISSQLGTYQSKEYLSVERVQGYIVVHYHAQYTDGDIGVRMVFDQGQRVAGHFFE